MEKNPVSMGLEIEINLLKNEVLDLTKKELEGILLFNEINDTMKRKIPIKLKLINRYKSNIDVDYTQGENEYFGNAKDISVTIYQNHYKKLLGNGSCGGRFLSQGRITIYKKNI